MQDQLENCADKTLTAFRSDNAADAVTCLQEWATMLFQQKLVSKGGFLTLPTCLKMPLGPLVANSIEEANAILQVDSKHLPSGHHMGEKFACLTACMDPVDFDPKKHGSVNVVYYLIHNSGVLMKAAAEWVYCYDEVTSHWALSSSVEVGCANTIWSHDTHLVAHFSNMMESGSPSLLHAIDSLGWIAQAAQLHHSMLAKGYLPHIALAYRLKTAVAEENLQKTLRKNA